MLVELCVRNLGVISEVRIPLGDGLVALTGETGAGKTMVVEAMALLGGARPDPGRVRHGADEAVVEGLFAVGEEEHVLRRVVPAVGRSRAYVDGELVTAARLGELADSMVELNGQHAQQELLRSGSQRRALDRYSGAERATLLSLRDELRSLDRRLDELGGDDAAVRREAELLRHQIDEIAAVAPIVDEEADLASEEDLLVGAVEHRSAGERAVELIGGEGAAADRLAKASSLLQGREVFAPVASRLSQLAIELDDVMSELRAIAEGVEPDTERLEQVRGRRHQLATLRRKYGADLAAVLVAADEAAARLTELDSIDERRAELLARRDELSSLLEDEGRRVGAIRRGATDRLAADVGAVLAELAMPHARVEVAVEDTEAFPYAGESVEIHLAAAPGAPAGPLQRVASGGELSRVMMALRLVLSGGPPTMVFDEIDAGVGGEAALAVGRCLAQLADDRQVLVVTHLPQVAAHADHQLRVAKHVDGTVTVTTVEPVEDDDRVVELSRMLSGSPSSATAREHASELLAVAARARGR
jgi:DNA repair protein RecN (Recombination protein N)